MHNIIYQLPVSLPLIYACVAIFHNMQYHRIVHFVSSRQYLDVATKTAKREFGMAAKFMANLPLYISATIFLL